MLKKYIVGNIFIILIMQLHAFVACADEMPKMPFNEEEKTQNDATWDNANEVFKNAPEPIVTPTKSNINDSSSLDNLSKQPSQNLNNPLTDAQPSLKVNDSDLNNKTKLPIGRTNTLVNSNFKKKSIPDYAKYKLIGMNKNLPSVYFESNLVGDAFNAVKTNDINNLRYLIKNYDLENFVDESGANLLLKAVQERRGNVLRMLIVNKYDINFLNVYKKSALHIAVGNQDLPMVKTLLTMKIDTTLRDSDDKTALDYAKETNTEIKDFIVSYMQ